MIVRLLPMNGPLRFIEFELLKNGTSIIRTDKGFLAHETWSKEDDEVLELTIDEFALRAEGDPNQLSFDVYDLPKDQRERR